MNILNWSELSSDQKIEALLRPNLATRSDLHRSELAKSLTEITSEIILNVRTRGDQAIREYTQRFDQVTLHSIEVARSEIDSSMISPRLESHLEQAIANILRFHEAQKTTDLDLETAPGIRCQRLTKPIESVGLYVPGGATPLVSTVMMLAIPAAVAGCPNRILCTPPDSDGQVNPVILWLAKRLGVQRVFRVGGAQAIAAMAYGTETIPKVDKIFGPGNAFVTEAKMQVSKGADGAAIDLPAGPSEVMVLADETAHVEWVAADLLSQAEHGPDSQVILVSTHQDWILQVQRAVMIQAERLSRRKVIQQSLNHARWILVGDLNQMIEVANRYGSEHLLIQVQKPRDILPRIQNAGSIFLGPYSPESMGDYASGPNHVLPTYGFARAYSGLSLAHFQKTISVQELSPAGFADLADTVEVLAALEGLDAHRQAVAIRRSRIEENRIQISNPLIREEVKSLKAYESARSLNSNQERRIQLDANESFESAMVSERTFDLENLNRYPQPQPKELLQAFSDFYQISAEEICIGRGSDEAIEWITRMACRPDHDSVLIAPPTYGMYEISARNFGTKVVTVPLQIEGTEVKLNTEAILEAVNSNPSIKVVWVCNPNNPTGTVFPRAQILTIARALKNRAWVVVDEAYAEFDPSESVIHDRFDNILVLRTLSKAWGAAALRCGVVIGPKDAIQTIQKIRAPYPLSSLVADAAVSILKDPVSMQKRVIKTVAQRDCLARDLQTLSSVVKGVFPSSTNFLLVQIDRAQSCFDHLKAGGIIARNRSNDFGIPNTLRFTIGTELENDRLMAVLREWVRS